MKILTTILIIIAIAFSTTSVLASGQQQLTVTFRADNAADATLIKSWNTKYQQTLALFPAERVWDQPCTQEHACIPVILNQPINTAIPFTNPTMALLGGNDPDDQPMLEATPDCIANLKTLKFGKIYAVILAPSKGPFPGIYNMDCSVTDQMKVS